MAEIGAPQYIEGQGLLANFQESNGGKGEGIDDRKSTIAFGSDIDSSVFRTARERNPRRRFEIFIHIVLVMLASMFLSQYQRRSYCPFSNGLLVFAFLAASVNLTVPGSNVKYKDGGPIPGILYSIPNLGTTFYPNGTYSGISDPQTTLVGGLNLALFE